MKKLTTLLTTLLLTFLLLSAAKCQEADTLVFPYYTIAQGDSLKAVIQEQSSTIDSLIILNNELNPLMIADTFNYTIMGLTDSLKVSVEKLGENVKIGLKNGEKIVFYVNF